MKAILPTSTANCVLLTLLWLAEVTASGQLWQVTSAPSTNWTCMAMSADGSTLVAGTAAGYSTPGPLFVSTNSGLTWAETTAPLRNWTAIACSADGIIVVAAAAADVLYISTNSAARWTSTGVNTAEWSSVACSADGRRMIASETNSAAPGSYGLIHASTDSGATWSATTAPLFPWLAVCSSSDGTRLAALGHDFRKVLGRAYVSADAGATWIYATEGYLWWTPDCMASSADGRTLLAQTLISTNAGATWNGSPFPAVPPTSVALSAEGGKMLSATVHPELRAGYLYSPTDRGNSWAQEEAPLADWRSVATSADGCASFAAIRGGTVYASRTTPRPALVIKRSVNTLNLSWLTPSMPFVLQQTAALTEAQWSDVDAQPTLNYTNLNQEVSLPAPNGPIFYRLVRGRRDVQ